VIAVPRELPYEGDPPRVRFGRQVRELRQRTGLRQADVAAAAGISVNYLSEMENGQRNPTLTVMLGLAHALGVNPRDLLAPFDA
jgi:transcriptional regulator with XRE-family HTH domain